MNIDMIRDLTYNNAVGLLQEYGVAVIERGTGFGKTYMLGKISMLYNKVLYLYPTEIIKKTAESCIEKYQKKYKIKNQVNFMTYRMVIMTENIEEIVKDYDLVIADECHRLGGEQIREQYYIINATCKKNNIHRLLATATPIRYDSFDIISEFGENRVVFPYTTIDSIEQGYLKAPVYSFGIYKTTKNEKIALKNLTSEFFRYKRILDVPTNIKETCEEYLTKEERKKMVYICFYSTFDSLHSGKEKVNRWFKKAFPMYKIQNIIVSSETNEYYNNVFKIKDIEGEENKITLIHCVDMLNMGYHVNSITGIVMLRATTSDVVYTQQLGRVMSLDDNSNKLVFDFVDNIERHILFSSKTQEEKTADTRLLEIDFDTVKQIKEQGKKDGLTKLEINKKLSEYLENLTVSKGNLRTNNKIQVNRKDWSGVVRQTVSFADLKDLRKKLEIVPLARRIRLIIESYYAKWCYCNNITYPNVIQEVVKIYDMSYEDYKTYLKTQVKKKFLEQLRSLNNDLDIKTDEVLLNILECDNTITLNDIQDYLVTVLE